MNIASYSLFRAPQPLYWRQDATEDRLSGYARFLPVLIRAHHTLWPGFELRLHHDEHARRHPYFPALLTLRDAGLIRLVPCGEATALTLAMLWRMKPLFEEPDALVLTCDLDSLPLLRLRRCVDEFMESGKAVMCVHGCESHNGVMGGGFGARGAAFRRLVGAETFGAFVGLGKTGWSAYAADEEFLRTVVWPRVANHSVLFSGNVPLMRCPDQRRTIQAPVPAELVPEAAAHGDDFAPYIGSAGYDVSAAFHFYQSLPLPVMATIRACEGPSLDLRQVMRI